MTTYRDSLIVAMVLFLFLDTLVIGARVFVRTRILSRAFGRDDFVLCLTYVSDLYTGYSMLESSAPEEVSELKLKYLDRICDPLWL